MSVIPKSAESSIERLVSRLAEARRRTDEIFSLLKPATFLARPIPVRHRFIFYLGHVEAFDWNLLGRRALGLPAVHAEWDRLFAFGIDPVDGVLPDDKASDWPEPASLRQYGERLRQTLDRALARLSTTGDARRLLRDGALLHAAIEHRLMHAETLAYMLSRVPLEGKVAGSPSLRHSAPPAPARTEPRTARIPAGRATLGLARGGSLEFDRASGFGWDNEFESHEIAVPEFEIDVHNVTNGQFLDFVRAGGYEERSLWSPADWDWKERTGVGHPAFWRETSDGWRWRGMFEDLPLPLSWPVYVSHAEASAYARRMGRVLPTEAEWQRAACGTPDGSERAFPWGDDAPGPRRGNFDFQRWDPIAIGSCPGGASAFGVEDLVGNGWEWTDTPFRPFPGFEPYPFYPGYSADFFDGRHFVLKGGSMRTDACLLRRSFRNWFQPHHPDLYAAFRCVTRVSEEKDPS